MDNGNNGPAAPDLEPALLRAWWPVAPAPSGSELQSGTLLGRKLAIFRDDLGNVRVTDATCPHRGADLSRGRKVEGAVLECPYHGWQWDGDTGRCVHIPSLGDEGAIPSAARLRTYPAQEYFGVVWTCLADEPMTAFPPPNAPTETPDEDVAVASIEFDTNVLATVENFRDVAHIYFVHSKTIAPESPVVERLRPVRDGWSVALERVQHVGSSDFYFDGPITIRYLVSVPHLASVRMSPRDSDDSRNYSRLFGFPSPLSLDRTRVFIAVATGPDFPLSAEEMLATERQVFAEDKEILDHLEPRHLTRELDQVSTVADAFTLMYRRAFFEFVDEATRGNGAAPAAEAQYAAPSPR